MENHITSRNLLLLTFIISLSFFYYLVIKSDFVYIQYDAYYYSAVADGFVDDGNWSNKVTVPPSNLRTPQNGIIVLNALLKILGADDQNLRLTVLAFINAITITLITFFCYRLFLLLDIPHKASWILSLTIPISFYYQMVLLQPTNDAIFALLSFYTLYFIITHNKLSRNEIIILFILATVIPFFRLTGLAIFVAPAIVALMQTKYRDASIFVALSIWCGISPYILNYILGFNISNIQSRGSEIVSDYSFDYFLQHIYNTFTLNIPEALLRFTYFTVGFTIQNAIAGIIISIVVIVFFFYRSKQAITENNSTMLVLIFYALINLVMFQMHPAQPTRYLITLSPLIPVIFFLKNFEKQHQVISIAVLSITLLISTAGILASDKPLIAYQKRIFSEQIQKYMEQNDFTLISYFPRVSYFLLNKSSVKNLDQVIKTKPNKLLILGPKNYQTYILAELNKNNIATKAFMLSLSYIDYKKRDKPSFGHKYEPVDIHAIVSELTYN